MMKLFCAIVGVTGSAFSVDVGEGQTVDYLKNAIKNARRNTLNHVGAGDLQLFLAKKKKGKGTWLTEAEVVKGVTDTTDFKSLKFARPILNQVGLSEKTCDPNPR
ncbi:hypothetical protein DVH05_000701 [Phytophthora capsici]|nr:hypothetical protein DVH05_000701 [Phytophthora capsici]